MHLFEYYFEGGKPGDWMMMYQVIAKDRTEAEEHINKVAMLSNNEGATLKSMRCTVKLLPEYLHAKHNPDGGFEKSMKDLAQGLVGSSVIKDKTPGDLDVVKTPVHDNRGRIVHATKEQPKSK